MNQTKWDVRFLRLAKEISKWSKDPSTQTGAVITDRKKLISVGYNGFAQGTKDRKSDYDNRELKYKKVVHCERNAVIFAQRCLDGCTLYTYPFHSCSVCAGMMMQAGISRFVAPVLPQHLKERWEKDFQITFEMYKDKGVEVVSYYQDFIDNFTDEPEYDEE